MIRLLLVEDDQTIAKIIIYYLEQTKEYTVVHAQTGGEAIAAARSQFDIILMDIMLPDVSGVDLCRRLRDWQQCPILFITCVEDDDMVVGALEAGGDDYLVKPFDNKVLNARIKAICAAPVWQSKNPWAAVGNTRAFALTPSGKSFLKTVTPTGWAIWNTASCFIFCCIPGSIFPLASCTSAFGKNPAMAMCAPCRCTFTTCGKSWKTTPSAPHYLRSEWGRGYWFDPEPERGDPS